MMLSNCFHFVILILIFLFLQDASCFFVKHVKTGMCINDTSRVLHKGSTWGNLSLLELSNNCQDPAAQFWFRDNGAMLNLRRKGCLAAYYKGGDFERYRDVFYIYASKSLNVSACAQDPGKKIYRAITHASRGALSVYYKGYRKTTFQTWCVVPKTDKTFAKRYGIDIYLGLTTPCDDAENKRFIFGSVTCYGNMVKNVNCPKDQYMVVKTASYRGLPATKKCGLSNDYTCEVDVTCLIRKLCDGQHECTITLDDSLIPGNPCPAGLTRYLYFEYQCFNTTKPAKPCVNDVSLSRSSLPNEGFVQIVTNSSEKKSVCWQSLKNNAKDVICKQLGYATADSLVEKAAPSDSKDAIFSGGVDCSGGEKYLSQCSITTSYKRCSKISYIKCFICSKPLLENEQRIPDSSFTASAQSSEGHSASDARISSGSSWCAPVSNEKHYLQVDLGKLYVLDTFATFGDSSSSKWVTSFNVNFTVDLVNWKPIQNSKIFEGNKNAYNDAAIGSFNATTTRALRFIPLTFEDQPCMRVEICISTLLPDKPRNLAVTNIKSRSAKLSWFKPVNEGNKPVIKFLITLRQKNIIILSNTTAKVYDYELTNLTPFTKYEIFVAAGNEIGFGEETDTLFITSQEAPSGPPRNIKATSRSASSLSFVWDVPEKSKQNGVVTSYTVCVSHSENEPCITLHIIREREWVVRNLNASTKYYIRVLASNKAGSGNYSETKGFLTNGKAAEKATGGTASTLTFSLEIPSRTFIHFYVVVWKLKDDSEPPSSDSYENINLVTYAETQKSTNMQPYIAAVVTSSGFEDMFVLGDGTNTSDSTARRRRSTSSTYYNGPLDPGTSYSIFQRIFINEKGDYYSTDWSPASRTKEYLGSPRVLTNMSSGDIKAKEGDLVNLLCSAQGEPPVLFAWTKDQKSLDSFVETQTPHRTSLLVLKLKDETSFGKYICHINDRFESTTHTIWIRKDKGTEENGDSGKYLAGIIVVTILLVILLVVFAYFVYRQPVKLSSTPVNLENETKRRNDSKDNDSGKEDANNYEEVEDDQATYTALDRSGGKENDDHVYCHLNVVQKNGNQEETGI